MRALADDLQLKNLDPLDTIPATPWSDYRPQCLAALSAAPWRTAGDTVERLELLAAALVAKNIAAELILAVTPHDVKAVGVTVPGALDNATVDLGDVWLLPPTLTLQYHFDTGSQFKPYVGAGVNATFFFDADEGPVASGIDYDPSFGGALQFGVDYDLDGEPGGWLLNADVKKIWINSDVSVDFTAALGATVDADVDINPTVVGIGFGYKY